jgi:hypothetical protein
VAAITAGSRNTRLQAARYALPGLDLHQLIAPALLGAFPGFRKGSTRATTVRFWIGRNRKTRGGQPRASRNHSVLISQLLVNRGGRKRFFQLMRVIVDAGEYTLIQACGSTSLSSAV